MREPIRSDRTPLLVFADDWGRHPSSCQHLIGRLLDDHTVIWVNTIGMRTPKCDWATVSRGGEKIAQWLSLKSRKGRGRPGISHPKLKVLNPRMWPSFATPFARRLNRELLLKQLTAEISKLPEPPIAVTTLPIVADLIGRLPVQRWVYYCVDDFAEWPGLDGDTLRIMEERLVKQADVLIAVSETLQDEHNYAVKPIHLLTHGVDLDHWRSNSDGRTVDNLDWLKTAEAPLVVFWGIVDRRMDVVFLKRLAEEMNRGTIVLIGPESNPDPLIASLPHVVMRSAVGFDALPQIAQAASVLVMPYGDLPVTRAMQPLKLKEYLATGKPVVVRDLPSTRPWDDCLDLADDPANFARMVMTRMVTGLPESQRIARVRLIEEGWEAKAHQFKEWITAPAPLSAQRNATSTSGASL